MKEQIQNCQVEWDKRRGVLYVHNKDTGATVVRISGLPACRDSVTLAKGMIDVHVQEDYVSMPDGKERKYVKNEL